MPEATGPTNTEMYCLAFLREARQANPFSTLKYSKPRPVVSKLRASEFSANCTIFHTDVLSVKMCTTLYKSTQGEKISQKTTLY